MAQAQPIPSTATFVRPETRDTINRACAELLDICKGLNERPAKKPKKNKAA